jgi:F0F1-type ATP synthase assembly protein I
MVRPVFWPLIGGFIAVLLVTILIGWIVDRRGEPDNHH